MAKTKSKVDDLFAPPTEAEIADDDLFAPPTKAETGDVPLAEKFETAARSGLEGLSLGLSEPLISGANAAVGQAIEAGMDPNQSLLDTFTLEKLGKAYDQDVERRRGLKEAMPGTDIAAQVTGGVLPAFATGGASLGAQGATKAAQAARMLDVGGVLGAKAAEIAAKQWTALAKGEAKSLLGKGAKGVADLAAKGVKGAAGAVAQEGIRQEVLEGTGFLKDGEAPELSDVAALGGAFGGGLGVLGKAAKAAKVMGTKAASVFLGVSPQHMEEYLNNYQKIRSAKTLEEVTEAAKDNIKKIKELAKTTQQSLTDDVADQLDAIKGRITKGSSEAYEVLGQSGKKFDNTALQGVIDGEQKKLLTKGVLIGEENKTAFNYLNGLKSDLSMLGPQVEATDVKKVIQALDQSYTQLAPGQFADTMKDRVVNQVRRGIDQMVKKEIPEYATKMKEVAALSELHADAFKQFGKDKNIKGVEQVLAQKNPVRSGLIEQMYEAQPDNLMAAKNARIASDAIKNIDEGNIGDKILQYSKGARNPQLKKQLESLGNLSSEDFMQALQAARINHYFSREFLRGSRNVNLWTMLMGLGAKLGDSSGQTTQRAFQSGAGAAILGSIDPTFGMIGATLGASVDLFGPSIAKQMLNAIGAIQGIPTVAKIRSLSLPENVKEIMVQDFIRAMSPKAKIDTDKKDQVTFFVPKEAKESVKGEVLSANNLRPEDKARMLNELSKENKITDFDKVIFGETTKPKNNALPKSQPKKSLPADLASQYYKFKKEENF